MCVCGGRWSTDTRVPEYARIPVCVCVHTQSLTDVHGVLGYLEWSGISPIPFNPEDCRKAWRVAAAGSWLHLPCWSSHFFFHTCLFREEQVGCEVLWDSFQCQGRRSGGDRCCRGWNPIPAPCSPLFLALPLDSQLSMVGMGPSM